MKNPGTVLPIVLLVGPLLFGCGASAAGHDGGSGKPTFEVSDRQLPDPLVVIAYGDMRFTDPKETEASNPNVRRAIVAKVADEHPAAVFLNGDLPWHGVTADYNVFHVETAAWRRQHLRLYPALGNHEFSQCDEAECLARWWHSFPELRGRRWYSVKLGGKILALMLDSDASLLPGSPQRAWLEGQIDALQNQVQFILVVLHHPPVADVQTGRLADHNPRANEQALADYLGRIAPDSKAGIVVSSGHIHNYERFNMAGVTYLVSGGGGAKPYEVERTDPDLYDQPDFPNFHYVRLTLKKNRLAVEMIRLGDYESQAPSQWQLRDRVTVDSKP